MNNVSANTKFAQKQKTFLLELFLSFVSKSKNTQMEHFSSLQFEEKVI